MKTREFKNFELTEENILLVYRRCKATDQTVRQLPIKVYYPHLCGMDSPEVIFDAERIILNTIAIYHMLGQLKAVHDKRPFMTANQGFVNYKGRNWTEKTSVLFALYALAIGSTCIGPFMKTGSMKVAACDIRELNPSYPRDDPNYAKNPYMCENLED